MSSYFKPPKLDPDADLGPKVRIAQLLKDRDQVNREISTRTYLDEPISVTVRPNDGATIVAMKSGKVWMTEGSYWKQVCLWPVPDTPAAELYDQLRSMNDQLQNLGYQEED